MYPVKKYVKILLEFNFNTTYNMKLVEYEIYECSTTEDLCFPGEPPIQSGVQAWRIFLQSVNCKITTGVV